MTLQQLGYALALTKHKSFNKAAISLGISQPGLSIQIKKLEDELGIILFDRSKKQIMPTLKGAMILDKANAICNEGAQLLQLAEVLNENHLGNLKLGIIPTLGPYLLPLFIGQLNSKYPELQFQIRELLTEDIIKGLASGELDGGIIATPILSMSDLKTTPLFYESFKVFLSQDHPLSDLPSIDPKQIPTEDVWLLKEGNCFRDQIDNICELSLDQKQTCSFQYESNNIESICRIVEYSKGLTFLPELASLHINIDKEHLIKDLAGPTRVREISLVQLPNHIKSGDLEIVSETIRKNLPKHMLSLDHKVLINTNVSVFR